MEGTSRSRPPFRPTVDDSSGGISFLPLFRCIENRGPAVFHWLQQGRNQFYVLYIAMAVLALLMLKVR